MAIKLLLMNKEAIVLGELAEKQAQSPAVKKFAQGLVAQHEKLEKALEPLIDDRHLDSIESIGIKIHYPRGEPGTQQPKLAQLSRQEKKMAEQHLVEARRLRDKLRRSGD